MTDPVKSRAVVLYTSRGRRPFPWADPEAVRTMPVPDPDDLLRYVEAVVKEVFDAFPLDWQGPDGDLEPALAVAEIAATVRDRHPELDAEAARAVAWVWSYSSWK